MNGTPAESASELAEKAQRQARQALIFAIASVVINAIAVAFNLYRLLAS
jgi:hypothetical protein